MKRVSLLIAAFAVVACNGDRLTGTAAQDAARQYQHAVVTRSPLVFVDGKEVAGQLAFAMDVKTIHSVQVLKGNAARELYGDRARDGVILIETKAVRED